MIDASGCIVCPGLIDHHAHISPLMTIGISGDYALFPSGVTAMVEAGGTGAYNYEGFRQVTGKMLADVKSYVYVSPYGLIMGPRCESLDPADFDEDRLAYVFDRYRSEVIGLKIRMSADIAGSAGIEPLKATIAIAEKLGVNVMVHTTAPACSIEEIAGVLREGDVFTHMNQCRGSTILDEKGRIKREVREARERGVVFESADGTVHLSLDVARAAVENEFYPDIISTDLTTVGLFRRDKVFSLLHGMSRYLNLGMRIEDVLKRTTENPARYMGEEGNFGCLAPGSIADIFVFKIVEKETVFGDCDDQTMTGSRLIRPLMTVKAGNIVYRDIEF